jgi:hypothetical protein
MLRLLVIAATAVNVMFGLGVALTRGAIFTQIGLPSPLPFYSDIFAVFLIGTGLAFIPAVRNPQPHRFYLWIVGAAVKLIVAGLFLRVWLMGVTPWSILIGVIVDGGIGAGFAYCLLKGK